jgi:hypothetical protein
MLTEQFGQITWLPACVLPYIMNQPYTSSTHHHENRTSFYAISQYDVLLVETENELAFIPHNHVGNNRLGIFVKMHFQEFVQSADDMDALNQVMRNLIGVVQSQCVDDQCQRTGKFLSCWAFDPERLNDIAVWTEVTTERVVEFLRMLFEQEQSQQAKINSVGDCLETSHAPAIALADGDKKRRRRSSLLRRSMSSGNMIQDEKKRVAHRKSILLQLQQYDVSEEEDETEPTRRDGTRKPDRSNKQNVTSHDSATFPGHETVNSSSNGQTPALPNSEARAALVNSSDSLNPTTNNGIISKPKLLTTSTSTIKSRQRLMERSSSFGDVPKTDSSTTIIYVANALDVLIERSNGRYQLARSHTGNNRLSVMMDMRQTRYMRIASNKMEVHRLCLDLIHLISEHYNGLFLLDETNGTFLALSNEQAAAAIASIFEDSLVSSSTSPPSSDAGFNASLASLQSNDSSFSSILPSTLQVSTDVHKAALESLHRRKKRQDTNSKLVQMATQNREMHEPIGHRQMHHEDRAVSARIIDDTIAPLDAMVLQPHAMIQQRRASVGTLQDRRPTLSSFSQELIRDLLLQSDESQHNCMINNDHSPLAGVLDDLF